MLGSDLYFTLPVWAQERVLGLRGLTRKLLREGGPFKEHSSSVNESQWLDAERMAAFQLQRLQTIVRHAIKHVPYYRDIANRLGLDADFPRSFEEFEKFPFLTKADVLAAGSAMISDKNSGPKVSARTSGTTGASMVAYRDLASINRENAFVWRHMQWAGMQQGDARVWIRGDKIVRPDQATPPYWRHARADNMLMMSAYHLSEGSALGYLEAIEAFDPVVIQGYPSAVLLLARYLVGSQRAYRGKRLRSIVTSSETVSTEDRHLAHQAFGCEVFDWFGSMERTTAIANCEHGKYHLLSDYGYTELETSGDGTHQIIGTGFDNFLMPFIRYRLGDAVALPSDAGPCACGRSFPQVDHIMGRVEDYILTPSGRRVFMAGNMLDNIESILEAQITQDRVDTICVALVQVPDAKPIDVAEVERSGHRYFGSDMKIEVKLVEQIHRTQNGKVRVVVRRI